MDPSYKFGYFLSHPDQGNEVVISGISGEFPCCNNVNEYEENLFLKTNMVTEMDDRRWKTGNETDIPKKAGLLNELDKFDNGLFGIHPGEARLMNPLLRIMMEEAMKAIMDAGVNPKELKGTKTGVFIATSIFRSNRNCQVSPQRPPNQKLNHQKGVLMNLMGNRIAYFLQIQGPVVVMDSACSSALTALEHAFKDIRTGNCDFAIVGGGNILHHPDLTLSFLKMGALNMDGKCKTFDDKADGYSRGEAVIFHFLQKLDGARRVYAKIMHAKNNVDGYCHQGITFPSYEAQRQLMSEVYRESKYDVNGVAFFELHGTGTVAGDSQEIKSVDLAMAQIRKTPLLIGSVKSNIGHTESVAGSASVIKAIIALETGTIAPNLHLDTLNKKAEPLHSGRLLVVTETTPIQGNTIGINNFGMGGSNSHIILQAVVPLEKSSSRKQLLSRIHFASGRTPESVAAVLSRVENQDYASLIDQLFAEDHYRHPYRGYVILDENNKRKAASTELVSKFNTELVIDFGEIVTVGKHFMQHPFVTQQMEAISCVCYSLSYNIRDIPDSILYNFCIVKLLHTLKLNPHRIIGNGLLCKYFEKKLNLEQAVRMLSNADVAMQNDIPFPIRKRNVVLVTSGEIAAHFFETIGSLYLHGFNPEIKHLNPYKFPVARGTPSISSLIKFQHERKWDYFQFGFSTPTQLNTLEIQINLKDDHQKYLSGHVVDGRNLFPAAGYLYYVWQMLAMLKGQFMSNVPVLFHDCHFLKWLTLYEEEMSTFEIGLNHSSGKYEILNINGEILAYGNVFVWKKTSNLVNPDSILTKDINKKLEHDEIYKALHLRGYEYKGLFKGLMECNLDVTEGKIRWDKNWITFLDAIFQMLVFGTNPKYLYVPITLKTVSIDPAEQRTLHEINGNFIPIKCCQDIGQALAGAVNVYRMLPAPIPRRPETMVPSLEKYVFLPNVGCRLSLTNSLLVNMEMVRENFAENLLEAVEIIDAYSDLKPLVTIMNDLAKNTATAKWDFRTFSNPFSHSVENVKIQLDGLKANSQLHLIIARKILQHPALISTALEALQMGGFLLTLENIDFNEDQVPGPLEIVSVHLVDDLKLVLLRKLDGSESINNNLEIINITTDLDWLPQLQKSISKKKHIVLYSESKIHTGLLGLTKCLIRESVGYKLSCFIFPETFNFEQEICQHQLRKQLTVNIFKGGTWGTYRYLPIDLNKEVETLNANVTTYSPGDISSLKWYQCREPISTSIQIFYSALNFKDVLSAEGRVRFETEEQIDMETLIGTEFAGIDRNGRRVAGIVMNGALGTTVPSNYVVSIPGHWSYEDAATVPLVYLTLIYALLKRIKLKQEMSILIHCGADGGVGLAALNIASYLGCKLYATASSAKKRAYLSKHYPQLTPNRIGNSSNDSLEQWIKKETKGRGVDIVLNSMPAEKRKLYVECLAKGGHWLELGRYDLKKDEALQLISMQNELSYHGIMLDRHWHCVGSEKEHEDLIDALQEGIKLGFVKPLPRKIFQRDQIIDAFRYMSSGQQLGKVLVKIRDEHEPQTLIRAIPKFFASRDSSYVIIGGLGGFGLELANWLISRGATKLILSSTKGAHTGYQLFKIKRWESYGVKIKVSTRDVTVREDCISLLQEAQDMGPLEGVFNLAIVMEDALLPNQTKDSFVKVLKPKSVITLLLDSITRTMYPHLKYFVVFSSICSGRGYSGLSNYGMANSIIESICEKRKSDGYSALAIQWGIIGDVGIVVGKLDRVVRHINNAHPQSIASCLTTLEAFLTQDEVIVSCLVVPRHTTDIANNKNVVETVLQILGVTTVSHQATLAEMGMDSIVSEEILKVLEQQFEIFLTQERLRKTTLSRLSELETERKRNSAIKSEKCAGVRRNNS